MEKIEVYTDGACSGNPGNGGYAFIILKGEKEILKLSGSQENATNNYMELKAIVRAIEHVISELGSIPTKNKIEVFIHSDSAYCINPVEKGWIKFWESNGWISRTGEPIKNLELWIKLNSLLKHRKFKFKFVKVKGHSGDRYNEMVDKAAKNAINRLNRELFASKGAKK
jgi:ribonuclease HI|nr:MAG TPA: ribonuclease HI [Caudoviricetes sp.]